MIVDLNAEDADRSITTGILIIGGGIAGLLLAAKLRSYRIPVAILESGGREQEADTHPLNRVLLLGDQYRGALHGRFRCLGGASTRRCRVVNSFLPDDFQAPP